MSRLADIEVVVLPHIYLNTCRGVISAADLLNASTDEILDNLKSQKVCGVKRITVRRDDKFINMKHLILTFATPDLPEYVKAAYMNLPVRPFIPNPLRCFQCQRFGHSKIACRGKLTCARCAEVGHESPTCKAKEACVNCHGDHPSYSRTCPNWILEKEITTIKVKNKCSYPEARRVVTSRTPQPGISYAAAAKKVTRSYGTQTDSVSLPLVRLPPQPTKSKPTTTSSNVVAKAPLAKSKALRAFKLKNAKEGPKKNTFTTRKALLSLEDDAVSLHKSDDEIIFDDAF